MKQNIEKRIQEYLISGFGVPTGLREEWQKMSKKEYKPSFFERVMRRIMYILAVV
jgi:hypothetical protein